jgi:uncharacterized protein YndB with AHSA1/START domain
MSKLFVDKTIEINAPATKVWEALTKPEFTDIWAKEFSSGGPKFFYIESTWGMGDRVEWKAEDGTVIVEGNVTKLELLKLLRYTVADTRSEKMKFSEDDGITYELHENLGVTSLHILHGDFSVLPEGEKYCRMSAETWERVLPKIKELAERSTK